MTEPEIQVPVDPKELTPEQNNQIAHEFLYQEEADLSEEDMDRLSEIFGAPEDLKLIRKLLNVVTRDERGFLHQDPLAAIQADDADLKKYAIDCAVELLASEKVRNALNSGYVRIKRHRQKKMATDMENQNQADFEEEQRTEEFDEEQEERNRNLPPNV